MADDLTTTDPFAGLDAGEARWLRGRTGALAGVLHRSADGMVRAGQILREVKDRLPHGHFMKWVETCLPFGHNTANRMMQVAEQFGQIPQRGEFEPSALYLLAQVNVPPEVREKALEVAATGERVTLAVARELVRPPARNGTADSDPADWRARPADDLDLRPVLAGALTMAGVRTAGQLADRLARGETLGLHPPDVADLRLALALARGDDPGSPCPACGGTGRVETT